MSWWHKPIRFANGLISIANLVKHIGMLLFIMLSALVMATSGLAAAILAAIALTFAEFRYDNPGSTAILKQNIKTVVARIVPFIILIVAVYILNLYIKSDIMPKIVYYAERISAILLVLPIIFERCKCDKWDNNYDGTVREIIKNFQLSHTQKLKLKLLLFLQWVLVLAGFLALVILNETVFALITVAGCIFGALLKVTERRYARTCELNTHHENQAAESSYNSNPQSDTGTEISEHDVERLVKKIADRWSYKEDTSVMLASGSIRYSVSVEVIGFNTINYTVNGKLLNVREEQLSTARTLFESKINGACSKIAEETKTELSKHKLPYSSYEINVNKGYIE